MRSHSRFCDYRDEGSAYDYHYGVSEFVSFYNSYMSLITADSGQTDVNCIYLNQLIGRLMYFPELTDDQVGQLVAITAMLSEDIYDENAYNQMFSLFNSMGI